MAELSDFMQVVEYRCLRCDFKCVGTDSEKFQAHLRTHPENMAVLGLPKLDYQGHPLAGSGYNQGFKAGQKQARAEVLAACKNTIEIFLQQLGRFAVLPSRKLLLDVLDAIEELQPAAKDLEALRLRSYRDGATGAAVWFVKLLHGHPEDPPQMGCKPEAIRDKLEKLLLKAYNEGAFAATGRHAEKLEELLREAEVKGIRWAEGRDIAQITAQLNELEKARAEGKG